MAKSTIPGLSTLLGGVETVAGVAGAVSNVQLLSGIKTVDGTGSGLDADKLQGRDVSDFAEISGAIFDGNISGPVASFTQGTFENGNFNNLTVTGSLNLDISTTDIPEGSNLYFTNQRVRDVVDGVGYVKSGVSTEFSDLTVTGNLVVSGTTTQISVRELVISDNMVYLNESASADVVNAVGDGANVTYTLDTTNEYEVGDVVRVTGITPSALNQLTYTSIIAVSGNAITITKTDTDTYTSGGVAYVKAAVNPDLGFSGGYNDGTYHHAGLFRDATDGIWKFFKNYEPEPGEQTYIDTEDPSFALANVQIDGLISNNVATNNAVVESLSANTVTATTLSGNISYASIIDPPNSIDKANTFMIVALSDETTAIEAGTSKVKFRAPFAMTLYQIPRASCNTASTSGVITVDINEGGTSILSTKLTIDANETTSTTAATPAVLSDTSIADDAEITMDIDTAGTDATGLKVTLYYRRT